MNRFGSKFAADFFSKGREFIKQRRNFVRGNRNLREFFFKVELGIFPKMDTKSWVIVDLENSLMPNINGYMKILFECCEQKENSANSITKKQTFFTRSFFFSPIEKVLIFSLFLLSPLTTPKKSNNKNWDKLLLHRLPVNSCSDFW